MTDRKTTCPACSGELVLREGTTRYRRGDRVVAVKTHYWECLGSCVDPDDGDGPFTFVDMETGRANDQAAAEAWQERFGEPMPPAKRPGRKTASPRTRRVPVLMSDDEVRLLDKARGKLSRGAYLRRALRRAAADSDRASNG